jgi:hypothetical protein
MILILSALIFLHQLSKVIDLIPNAKNPIINIVLAALALNYTIYQIFKLFFEFKKEYKKLFIMYLLSIILTLLFLLKLIFSPMTAFEFRNIYYDFWAKTSILLSLYLSLYDGISIFRNNKTEPNNL